MFTGGIQVTDEHSPWMDASRWLEIAANSLPVSLLNFHDFLKQIAYVLLI